jgi:glycine betaine/proline transport system substrate-binding protein
VKGGRMSIRRKWAIAPLVLAMAVFAAACSDVNNNDNSGSGGGGSSSAGGVPDNSAITIKLAVNAWVGAEANANVAANLLRDKLGYTVELVKIDEFEQFPALASGDLDATLEVWPSVHPKDYKNYIKANAGVIDAGPLGVVGQIGWFIPTYMVEKDPSLATWEGLKGKESMFATAETGSSGQLVDADPAFGSYDQAIADNLGLDFKVIYAGSEAAELTALDAAYTKQAPFLFYFWTPHWAQAKYDLTLVQLPDITPACEDAAANDVKAYACAYPPDPLYKAFNADLQTKAPAAYALLKAMNYTNDDQNPIALAISDGTDPTAAAQTWIDANPTKWQPWVDAGLAAS